MEKSFAAINKQPNYLKELDNLEKGFADDLPDDTDFICPLSSQSYPEFQSLHVELPPRDNLKVVSFALTEHCRAISTQRLTYPRIAQLTDPEIKNIVHKLQVMIE